jgi:hypothetical protein
VEAELRDAFRELHGKIDAYQKDIATTNLNTAVQIQRLNDSVSAAHERLDEHQRYFRAVGGLILSMIIGLGAWIWMKITGERS